MRTYLAGVFCGVSLACLLAGVLPLVVIGSLNPLPLGTATGSVNRSGSFLFLLEPVRMSVW